MSDSRKEADDEIQGFNAMTDSELILAMNLGLEAQLVHASYHQGRVLKYLIERTERIADYIERSQNALGRAD